MPKKSEGAMKISMSRASKRAPTWHSCTITPKSLSGQPLDWVWIRRSRGWPERDLGVIIQLCPVGARFEVLDALIFIAPSVSSCIFFTSLDFPLERCVQGQFDFEFNTNINISKMLESNSTLNESHMNHLEVIWNDTSERSHLTANCRFYPLIK